METNGPLGTLWVGLGLSAFYIALIWINTLLGIFLTPLFIIPATWLMDKVGMRRRTATSGTAATANPPLVTTTGATTGATTPGGRIDDRDGRLR